MRKPDSAGLVYVRLSRSAFAEAGCAARERYLPFHQHSMLLHKRRPLRWGGLLRGQSLRICVAVAPAFRAQL